jgi:hypothetical protein
MRIAPYRFPFWMAKNPIAPFCSSQDYVATSSTNHLPFGGELVALEPWLGGATANSHTCIDLIGWEQ